MYILGDEYIQTVIFKYQCVGREYNMVIVSHPVYECRIPMGIYTHTMGSRIINGSLEGNYSNGNDSTLGMVTPTVVGYYVWIMRTPYLCLVHT